VRLLVQRVAWAEVRRLEPAPRPASVVGRIAAGLLVLVGVAPGDGAAEVAWAAAKLPRLRIFADADGRMNLDLAAAGGEILLVSQFTLFGDVRGGRRPGFSAAAPPDHAEPIFAALADRLRTEGATVATGAFGRAMHVASINDGPVTLWLDSTER
jgi:D-aminoacyl-tRNA deacylase